MNLFSMKGSVILIYIISLLYGGIVFAEQDVFELDRYVIEQKQLNTEHHIANNYFYTFLNRDINKAKALYLYLTSKGEKARYIHENAEDLTHNYSGKNKSAMLVKLANESKFFEDSMTLYKKMENELHTRYVYIEQLKENASFVDTNKPILEIVEGRLDTDHDGVPDDKELATGEWSPVNGNSGYHN